MSTSSLATRRAGVDACLSRQRCAQRSRSAHRWRLQSATFFRGRLITKEIGRPFKRSRHHMRPFTVGQSQVKHDGPHYAQPGDGAPDQGRTQIALLGLDMGRQRSRQA